MHPKQVSCMQCMDNFAAYEYVDQSSHGALHERTDVVLCQAPVSITALQAHATSVSLPTSLVLAGAGRNPASVCLVLVMSLLPIA